VTVRQAFLLNAGYWLLATDEDIDSIEKPL